MRGGKTLSIERKKWAILVPNADISLDMFLGNPYPSGIRAGQVLA